MDSHSKTFEQYCCVKGRNVAVEEITYHDGSKCYRCSMHSVCEECNNEILKNRFEKSIKDEKKD